MPRMVRGWLGGVTEAGLNLLFPPRCVCCNDELSDGRLDRILLCDDCRILLGPESWPGCRQCGAIGGLSDGPAGTCPLCSGATLQFDRAIPLGGYNDQLREVVLRMKRPSHDALSVAVGKLVALRRGRLLAELNVDVLVAIPMYWKRRLARGTNSPDIIARSLAGVLNRPVARRVLQRCRNTLPQIDLSPRQRLQNVRGAFRVRRGRRLDGQRILLVDDVLTTGATCSEAARVLKQAGAAMVAAVVVARAQAWSTT